MSSKLFTDEIRAEFEQLLNLNTEEALLKFIILTQEANKITAYNLMALELPAMAKVMSCLSLAMRFAVQDAGMNDSQIDLLSRHLLHITKEQIETEKRNMH